MKIPRIFKTKWRDDRQEVIGPSSAPGGTFMDFIPPTLSNDQFPFQINDFCTCQMSVPSKKFTRIRKNIKAKEMLGLSRGAILNTKWDLPNADLLLSALVNP